MDLIKFVPEQLLILVAALYVIGIFLKASKIKDWTIPWILLVVGIIGAIGIEGISVLAIIEGVICTGVAVLINQLIKQSTEKKDLGN
ncbi:phage holin family protein [Clostridium hydrogeniformans]|uniref:phage holin family protein n=1 Tax=Clostridium hydrogeniformans TaxID=349933 RepID=UPI0004810D33|nr:phage holin family protein [Clostridium hydrogeniformans]